MRPLYWLLFSLIIIGCSAPPPVHRADQDAALQAFADDYVRGYLAWRPQEGAVLGLHEYDGKVTDLSAQSIAAERLRLRWAKATLSSFRPADLSPAAQYEWQLLSRAVDREQLQFEVLRVYTRNPMAYTTILGVDIYIKRDFAPFEQRLRSMQSIFEAVPGVLAAARLNLDKSLPKPFVETAIEMADALAIFWEKDVAQAIQSSSPSPALQFARYIAIAAMRDYARWLKAERLPNASLEFALGASAYRKMLQAGERITISPDALLELGLAKLRETQRRFAEVARQIDPSLSPQEVYKRIQKEHPTAERLIPETARNLEAIRQFLIDHSIITIPSEVRVQVQETPGFMRAVSFASMDTPGPFETRATEAYYYVTPVEPHWPEAQKEEWLTAFNYYTTDIVSVHEAYPGHYVQFLCLNASPASRIAKIFGSYAFIEGWAHYTEQMMIEEGFGAGPNAAKYHLAQLGEALLRLCRMCASLQMHCRGMTVDEATSFFERECYYEDKPAAAEARRGAYDPEYLYYSLGKLQVLKLRDDWKAQEGVAFSLRRFHDEMLRQGAPPIRLLRERMLKNPALWDKVL